MSAAIVPTGFGTPVRPQSVEHRPASPRLRLTRRGRVVFTTLASVPLIVWALIAVLGSGVAAADSGFGAGAAQSFEYVTVGDGDSLWAIAESIAPDDDPRVVIDEIMRLNGLADMMLEPGQRLALPAVP
jgi:hypothetical protein